MADIGRPPLIVGRRDPPVSRTTLIVGPSLLATTLAVAGQIPLPIGGENSFTLQDIHPGLRNYLNADTSQSTPKALIADAQAPQPQAAYVQTPCGKFRPVSETSRSSIALISAVVAPVVNAPQSAPSLQRLTSDTSQDSWQLQPVALYQISNPPQASSWVQRTNADTSQSAWAVLQSIQAPVFNSPQEYADRRAIGDDTTAGTPKTLTTEGLPVVNPPIPGLEKPRTLLETSQSTNLPIAAFIPPAPFAQYDWPSPVEYRWKLERDWFWPLNPDYIPAPPAPAFFLHGNDDGEKKKKYRNHRQEVREAILKVFNGPEEIKEEAKELLQPFVKFAEVNPQTVQLEKLVKDLEVVQRLIDLAQLAEDDDEEALLMLL
jgi:hypothetical protein